MYPAFSSFEDREDMYPACYRPGEGTVFSLSVYTSTGGEYPIPGSQVQVGGGGFTLSTPLPHPGLDWVPPIRRSAWRALATGRAVCLLRSRRRTFLYYKVKLNWFYQVSSKATIF